MFGSILKELRENSGLTQSELAQALNLTDATIGNYEQGSRKPRNDTLKAIAKYFNVSVDYLLGFENPISTISYSGSDKKIVEVDNLTFEFIKELKDLADEQKEALLQMAKAFNKSK